MVSSALILSFLLRLPTCYKEDPDINQLDLISQAIAINVDTISEATALITIGTFESAWCKKVGSGKRKGGSGAGYWQIEPGSHRIKPFAGLSLEELTHAAGEALWLWRHSHQCGSSIKARFTGYAGVKCNVQWSGAIKRTNFYYWAYAELNKEYNSIIINNEVSQN
jgi:hypothetical protein